MGSVTIVGYGINPAVGLCVSSYLSTYLDEDEDGITLCLDDLIYLVLSDKYLYGCNDGKLKGLLTGVQYVINYCVGLCIYGRLGTGLDVYADRIILGFDEVMDKGFSDRYLQGFNYGKLGSIVT